MLSLWPTWVLPVLLAVVWVAVAISEWRRSNEPVPDVPDWQNLAAGNPRA